MAEKKPPNKYREGAKGHCYWCGRPEAEHGGEKKECPDYSLRGQNSKEAHVARGNKKVRGGDWFES